MRPWTSPTELEAALAPTSPQAAGDARPGGRCALAELEADGRQRPLGVAALEDKIVQRAAVEVLDAIYEEDFRGFSYGFRPKRGHMMRSTPS